MLKFTIEPYDVLFFGSGKPFNVGSNVESIFPPFPHSFAAAIYAKFVSETGITIKNDKGIYKAVYGPFIEKNSTIYFPAPSDILKEKKKEDSAKFKIASRYEQDKFSLINIIEDSDLGNKINSLLWYKPDKNDSNDYEPFKSFISLEGLKKWYNNENLIKKDILNYSEIFEYDERVSINIDHNTGIVKAEDGIYRVNFFQLKKDVRFVFWVEADFNENSLLYENNIKNDDNFIKIFENKPMVLKLGGEKKTAKYNIEIHNFKNLFNDFKQCNNGFKKILFLSCGIFNNSNIRIIDYFNGFLGGVIGGYEIVGINSKFNKDKYGQKTVRVIKPGSVVYLSNYNEKNNESITFFNQNDFFIGSNLILIK